MITKVKAIVYEPRIDVGAVFGAVEGALRERDVPKEEIKVKAGFVRRGTKAWDVLELYVTTGTFRHEGRAPRNFVVDKGPKRRFVFKVRKDETVNIKGIVDRLLET